MTSPNVLYLKPDGSVTGRVDSQEAARNEERERKKTWSLDVERQRIGNNQNHCSECNCPLTGYRTDARRCRTCQRAFHGRQSNIAKQERIERANAVNDYEEIDRALDITYVDHDFANWLAGFIDGEGSFLITKTKREMNHTCAMAITLRIDDKDVLDEAHRRLGIGVIAEYPNRQCPSARWTVGSKLDCLKLVAILETHPLRAKKSRDFEVWKRAVWVWNLKVPNGNAYPMDWSTMKALREELHEVRKMKS